MRTFLAPGPVHHDPGTVDMGHGPIVLVGYAWIALGLLALVFAVQFIVSYREQWRTMPEGESTKIKVAVTSVSALGTSLSVLFWWAVAALAIGWVIGAWTGELR